MRGFLAIIAAFAFLSLSGLASAGCATSQYITACSECSFDASGNMDSECEQSKEAAGKGCVASSYPLAATLYSMGACSEIDACAVQLRSCKDTVGTGIDNVDCVNPAVGSCFIEADKCVDDAAHLCEDATFWFCPFVFILPLLIFAAFAFAPRMES